jgi:hypothetical protein
MSRIWDGRRMPRVTETGALWRGYGWPVVSRKWDGSVPFRVGLSGRSGFGLGGDKRKEKPQPESGGTGGWGFHLRDGGR